MGKYEIKLISDLLKKEADIKQIIAETASDYNVKSAAATQYLNCMVNLRKLNKGC